MSIYIHLHSCFFPQQRSAHLIKNTWQLANLDAFLISATTFTANHEPKIYLKITTSYEHDQLCTTAGEKNSIIEDVIIKQSSTTSFTSNSLLDTNVNSLYFLLESK